MVYFQKCWPCFLQDENHARTHAHTHTHTHTEVVKDILHNIHALSFVSIHPVVPEETFIVVNVKFWEKIHFGTHISFIFQHIFLIISEQVHPITLTNFYPTIFQLYQTFFELCAKFCNLTSTAYFLTVAMFLPDQKYPHMDF